MVTIASLGGASRNRSTFLRQVTTVPLLGNLLFPSIMCLLVAPRRFLSAVCPKQKNNFQHPSNIVQFWFPKLSPDIYFVLAKLGKKYFHEDALHFQSVSQTAGFFPSHNFWSVGMLVLLPTALSFPDISWRTVWFN